MEIKFKNVSYAYDDNYLVLKDINLNLKNNKINGIIGNNGSGKTTLVKLIGCFIKPTTGSIKIGDISNSKKNKTKRNYEIAFDIAFIDDENTFLKTNIKREFENILSNYDYKKEETKKRILNALELVGLDETYLSRDYYTLSKSEQYFVTIASYIILNPQVFIFDDPNIFLDNNFEKKFVKLINLLKIKYKKTIIITSNDVDFIHQLSDYIIVIDKGKIINVGDKYEVFDKKIVVQKIGLPRTILFSKLVKSKKNIHLGYRDKVNDLIKDIYRNAK